MDKYWYMSLIEITFKWLFFQVDEGGLDVEVTNLPSGVYEKKIQSRLKKLSENCGGRVVSVCKDVAVLRFKCHNDAAKYVTSYWNIETSYWNIKTSHWNIKRSYWNMLFCGDCFGLLVKWGGDLGGQDFIEWQVEIFFWLDNACTDIQIFYWYIFVLNEPALVLKRSRYVKITLIHFMKLNIMCVFNIIQCKGHLNILLWLKGH